MALNNDENLGVPEVSGKHGPAVASQVASSGEPPTHGNNHPIPGDVSEPGSAPSHGHGKPGSEINPIVALNNENLGVPEVSEKHGPAVANSGEPPTHGNNHSIPDDISEHGNAPSHSHGKPGSEINPIVALNNDENLGVPEVSGKPGPTVASPVASSGEPPTHGNNHPIPGDVSEHGSAPSLSHGETGSEINPIAVPEVSGQHGPAVASPVANSGELPTHGNDHSIPGDVSEHGAPPSHSAPPSTAPGTSGSAAAGTPGLGDLFQFIHAITGSENSGVIELTGVDHTPASAGQHANAAGNAGPEETQAIELSLPWHSVDHVPNHAGNAIVTHAPHDLMV